MKTSSNLINYEANYVPLHIAKRKEGNEEVSILLEGVG